MFNRKRIKELIYQNLDLLFEKLDVVNKKLKETEGK